ncbi:formate dehydrogenase accessory sulfurtransferase FdhD [Craterilacuibacter sp. RT1T]|uniref:formate dehydrogenase accessory sulfurtransferase FdhD n=1 Tax=Craterilacuibacter sp. RT1T TaxID=2942211 RepID=UPI0020C002DD|nr:formate dehydrogenase accessory sulfurtransferase FdhD [Craterilacuibacter sp. RT1T]MCL6262217.1 formate dehydrogenase accessory sulfurtransferase FdhD [Craterilacuibacter sp. RT1T]
MTFIERPLKPLNDEVLALSHTSSTVCLQALPAWDAREDDLACEVPVALVYNGISHAVMMATPEYLEDFALGFSLAEGIATTPAELYDIEVRQACRGFEVHIELASARFSALKARRRQMAGRTGCGLCGVDELDAVFIQQAVLPFSQTLAVSALDAAVSALRGEQKLGLLTGATHAAAWLDTDGVLQAVREDVGRHVALDKLLGWRARSAVTAGAALVTSRASYEMVEKAVSSRVEILLAMSAPTELAVNMAQAYGLTLIGFARPGRANIYSHGCRIQP